MQMEDSNPRPIILCADDYGLDEGISRAILQLAEGGRISALSVMVGGRDWQRAAPLLRPLLGKIAIGLHFTLTELPPLGAMPQLAPGGHPHDLNKLLRLALLRRIDPYEVGAELHRQAKAFIEATGQLPDHIDGHQHIHVLPGMREPVLALAKEYGCAVRRSATAFAAFRSKLTARRKAAVINLLAGDFDSRLQKHLITCNAQYFGLHHFNPTQPIGPRYRAWLRAARPYCLINCHPSRGQMLDDKLSGWRQYEYDFLASPAWPAMLREENCTLMTWPLA